MERPCLKTQKQTTYTHKRTKPKPKNPNSMKNWMNISPKKTCKWLVSADQYPTSLIICKWLVSAEGHPTSLIIGERQSKPRGTQDNGYHWSRDEHLGDGAVSKSACFLSAYIKPDVEVCFYGLALLRRQEERQENGWKVVSMQRSRGNKRGCLQNRVEGGNWLQRGCVCCGSWSPPPTHPPVWTHTQHT